MSPSRPIPPDRLITSVEERREQFETLLDLPATSAGGTLDLSPDFEAVLRLLLEGTIVAAAESACGPLQ